MPKKRLTKADKRRLMESDRGIVDFIQVQNHFFGDLTVWLNGMADGRHQSYITYTQPDLVFMGIMKNVCSATSMNQMNGMFNNENCIRTLSLISGNEKLSEIPDGDTLNYYLELLPPDQLEEVKCRMISYLIRSKLFYNERLLSKYWKIAIDGTGLFYFKERHCPHCLVDRRKEDDGKETVRYYHKVVEAKLILSGQLVLSIGTEFIENENEDVTKQDCEINAAKRLMSKIKDRYPRLPVCLLGDALFLKESVMGICEGYGWKYIFTLKEGAQPNITKDYHWLKDGGAAFQATGILAGKGTGFYINRVGEVTGKEETFNIFEYNYTKKEKGSEVSRRLMWSTNIDLKERNIGEMISCARSRWKIENEGFNNQKNGIYKIEHLNSRNSNAMKNHYLLTQIADILMQLYLSCNKMIKIIGQGIKNTSSLLLESFRQRFITDEDVSFINKYTTVRLS
jgi:hypothetical protein